MDSLAGVFETLQKHQPGPRCGLAMVMDLLSVEDVETLNGVLNNRDVPSSVIEKALIQYGHRVSRATIANHRRRGNGGCRCER